MVRDIFSPFFGSHVKATRWKCGNAFNRKHAHIHISPDHNMSKDTKVLLLSFRVYNIYFNISFSTHSTPRFSTSSFLCWWSEIKTHCELNVYEWKATMATEKKEVERNRRWWWWWCESVKMCGKRISRRRQSTRKHKLLKHNQCWYT